MAQRTTRDTTAQKLAKKRSESRLSLFQLAVRLSAVLPETYPTPSPEKLRRLENGSVPEPAFGGVDYAVILAGLAEVYEMRLGDLSPAAAETMRALRPLIGSASARSDLRDQTTGCLASSAA